MSDDRNTAASGPSQRNVEIGLAILIGIFGLTIIGGAIKAGIGWGFDGPQAGFFPFYVGLLVVVASAVTLYQELTATGSKKIFADWGQLKQVLSVRDTDACLHHHDRVPRDLRILGSADRLLHAGHLELRLSAHRIDRDSRAAPHLRRVREMVSRRTSEGAARAHARILIEQPAQQRL
jgi:hypothetical protein